ncbi:hypothetical protein ACF0H5_006644 [Mactra antiquata]
MADLLNMVPGSKLLFLALWICCIVSTTLGQGLALNNQDNAGLGQQQQPIVQQQQQQGDLKFNGLSKNNNNLLGNHLPDGPALLPQVGDGPKFEKIGNKIYSQDELRHLQQNLHIFPDDDRKSKNNKNNNILNNNNNLVNNNNNINDNINGNNIAKQGDLLDNNQVNNKVINMGFDNKMADNDIANNNLAANNKLNSNIELPVGNSNQQGGLRYDNKNEEKNVGENELDLGNRLNDKAEVSKNEVKAKINNGLKLNMGNNADEVKKTEKPNLANILKDEKVLNDIDNDNRIDKDVDMNEPKTEIHVSDDVFDPKSNDDAIGRPDLGVINEFHKDSAIDNLNDFNNVKNNEVDTIPNRVVEKDTGVINVPGGVENNEIPRDVPAVDTQPVQHDPVPDEVEEKPGSLKVVWDWSDFAVNFEQYVMPEQKIRRAPHSTTGEPWPMPQYYVSKKDKVYRIDKTNFKFDVSKIKCDIIEKAVDRYRTYILEDAVEDMYDNFQHAQSTMFEEPSLKYDTPLYMEAPLVTRVLIKIRKPCARYPTAKSDETYDLFVKRTGIHIWANEVWGALRGLETLSQIVFKGSNQVLYIRDTVINDYPRFSHRGLLMDTARHFLFKDTIYDILEGMAQNKMNVLHWHIVDDQSFPFYSNAYPDLSAKGAFHPTFVYMPEDIADIIEFARLRGIRVEPEFDTPGHTYSWGLSRPDILTQCYQGDRPVDGYLGPMDPSKNETFRFLKNFFKDVLHQFKDQYIHLGGDEVPMTCWQSNMEITKFLAKLEGKSETEVRNADPYYYSYDIRKVLEYYVTRLIKDLKSLGAKRSSGVRMVFWQEIMNNNVQLPNDTIIQVWQGGMEEVERAISLGMNVIYSTCWYLDLIEYGTKWSKYYQCDPADTTYGFSIDESKVLGGEACLWAEYIDNENLMTTLWPRASAVAERLWSNKDVRDLDAAAARLQEHRCRMLSRGLGVGQISGPDYCLRRGKRRQIFNETTSNCTLAQCAQINEKSRVEVENIKVEFEQKGGRISDCSQAVLHAGSQLTVVILLLIVVAIALTFTFTKKKIAPVRMCKNKTILMVFVTLILVYFMCYTSIWMQALEFKGSFEKRVSSNVQT